MSNISIIIPTYKDGEKLNNCLKALEKQSYSTHDFEVIIVNNDPDEKLKFKQNLDLNLKVIVQDKPGSYAARNKGIEQASGEILGFTDADCTPDHKWIQNAIVTFENNSEIDLVGGCISQYKEIYSVSEAVFEYQKMFSFDQKHYINNKGFSVTANLFVKRNVFQKIGKFNSELFSGGDFEFGLRAKKAGFVLRYQPNMIVAHPVRGGVKSLIKKKLRTTQGAHDMRERSKLLLHIIRLLVPPLKSCPKINEITSFRIKIKVFLITWFLKLVECFEIIRLLFGRQKRSRI